MVKNILFMFRRGHAYWRSVPFASIAELYLSRFLRILAQNLVDVFVTVYLYQNGYSVVAICLFLAFFYGLRAILSWIFAYIVAWLGPKTSIALSNIVAVPALLALSYIGTYTTVATVVYFVFQGISLTLLTIATDVQFSSIKSDGKAGGEIGAFYAVEKIAAAAAPAIGGFLAVVFGPEKVMIAAAVIMFISALPLYLSPEKIRPRQMVIYDGLPWNHIKWQLASPVVRGANYIVTSGMWALFIAIAVLSTSSNDIYGQIGVFFSISFATSIITSQIYGSIIDKRQGEKLLKVGALTGALTNGIRPFVATPLSVGLVNVATEASVNAYSLPILRGQYDMADRLPGYRVVYFSLLMMFFCIGAFFMSLIAAGLTWWLGDIWGLQATFVMMALVMPFVMKHGFDSLRPKK